MGNSESKIYIYDASLTGLLTALALSVKSGDTIAAIVSKTQHTPTLFDQPVYIKTDEQQADRLAGYLKGLGPKVFKLVVDNFLSEEAESGLHLHHLIKISLVYGDRVINCLTDDSISYLTKNAQRVEHEAHKMLGFIRFRQLKDNLLYAPIEPDFNIIGYCVNHFRKRLKNQHWIIHDVRRDISLYWDSKQIKGIDVDPEFTQHVLEYGEIEKTHLGIDEAEFQKLWQIFHTSIANSNRANRRLQRQLMPVRYWKYLIETPE